MSGEKRTAATDWIKKQMVEDYGTSWGKMTLEKQLDAIASFMTGYMQLRSKKVDFIMIADLRTEIKKFSRDTKDKRSVATEVK